MAQGFSQRPGIDYDETYSLVVYVITFQYLISLATHERLDTCLMDVVTSIYMGQLIMMFIWKSLKDLKCLKHIIQIPKRFTQSSYKGSYMG
jgi:hypothetical protein